MLLRDGQIICIENALAEDASNIGNIRETFFFNQVRVNYNVLSSTISDFQIDGMTFEIGGKGQKQISPIEKGYIVKDNIEFAFANIIPLWHFGMTY